MAAPDASLDVVRCKGRIERTFPKPMDQLRRTRLPFLEVQALDTCLDRRDGEYSGQLIRRDRRVLDEWVIASRELAREVLRPCLDARHADERNLPVCVRPRTYEPEMR